MLNDGWSQSRMMAADATTGGRRSRLTEDGAGAGGGPALQPGLRGELENLRPPRLVDGPWRHGSRERLVVAALPGAPRRDAVWPTGGRRDHSRWQLKSNLGDRAGARMCRVRLFRTLHVARFARFAGRGAGDADGRLRVLFGRISAAVGKFKELKRPSWRARASYAFAASTALENMPRCFLIPFSLIWARNLPPTGMMPLYLTGSSSLGKFSLPSRPSWRARASNAFAASTSLENVPRRFVMPFWLIWA